MIIKSPDSKFIVNLQFHNKMCVVGPRYDYRLFSIYDYDLPYFPYIPHVVPCLLQAEGWWGTVHVGAIHVQEGNGIGSIE